MKTTAIIAAAVAVSMSLALPYADARGGRGGRGMGGWRLGGGGGENIPGSSTQRDRGSLLQNINKGQLSEKEVDGLKAQQEALKKFSEESTGDGKLSKDDIDTFTDNFDAAAFYIWSKGSDEDGKVSTRYGTRVCPIAELAKRLDADNLNKAEARKLYDGLRSIVTAKLSLNEELAPEARASLQRQLNESLARYFMVK
jgi:hypothetical protein